MREKRKPVDGLLTSLVGRQGMRKTGNNEFLQSSVRDREVKEFRQNFSDL